MNVDKAKINDAAQMHQLINRFAEKGLMLPRALSEIYENLRDFFVLRQNDKVIGCVALHIAWADLAEIKSLAVCEENQAKGYGGLLIRACLEEARKLGIPTIFCLTYRPTVFEKHQFVQVEKMELPRKIWGECYRCSKFPDCDEVALVYKVETES